MLRVTAIAITSCLLSACSGVIHKPFSLDSSPSTSVSVDARQRAILVTDKAGEKGNRRMVCAEPSPDVMSALAASGSISLKVPEKGEVGASMAIAEAVRTIGRRTQTVQVLRDGLYRACEAFLNGAIDETEYKLIVMGFDNFAITMVAIDGLTADPIAPDQVSSQTKASAGGTGTTSDSTSGTGTAAAPTPRVLSPETVAAIREIVLSYLEHAEKHENRLLELFAKTKTTNKYKYAKPREEPPVVV